LYLAGFLFALGGLFLTYSLFYTLSRWIVNPFQQMITVMKKVQRGDMQSRFISHGKDEIAELGDALNNMIVQLGELIEREYKAAINQRNAEYMALQSQIQPHFLYNTLNSFIALNRMGERASLEKAIYSLSNMLRYTLGPGDWATVEDEFQFLQRYCDLQRLRFQERLTVDVHYQSEVSRLRIPKLLLQPLIENALIHGIEPLTRSCRLVVRARLEQDGQPTLEMSVYDDGAGFNLQDTGSKRCIGLANVRERLKMAHPASSFSMTSTLSAGTEIRIAIPVDGVVPSLLGVEVADESSYR
jgi:two-component system sensor histidine kinase YesM